MVTDTGIVFFLSRFKVIRIYVLHLPPYSFFCLQKMHSWIWSAYPSISMPLKVLLQCRTSMIYVCCLRAHNTHIQASDISKFICSSNKSASANLLVGRLRWKHILLCFKIVKNILYDSNTGPHYPYTNFWAHVFFSLPTMQTHLPSMRVDLGFGHSP